MANFGSDNAAGIHPKIIESIAAASTGTAPAYGTDRLTESVENQLADILSARLLFCLLAQALPPIALGLRHSAPLLEVFSLTVRHIL